jgi:GNAT superfamily N-acetyltransferase
MSRPSITTITEPARAVALVHDLAELYRVVYSEPPYREGDSDVARFAERYRRQSREPGLRLTLARDQDGELSGFAYGLPLQATLSWWDEVEGVGLPSAFTREDGRRTFAIFELAVRATARRQGLGRALHATLLDGIPAERVTLMLLPGAAPATRLYATLGYRANGNSDRARTCPHTAA